MTELHDIKKQPSSRLDIALMVGLTACITIVFWQTLGAQFINNWDDGGFLYLNPRMNGTWGDIWYYLSVPYQNIYSPTAMLSLMFDKVLFGLNPFWFHLHNILGHIVSAIFLMLVLRRLAIPSWWAFAATLFWAVHPQRVESVAWVVERKDIACNLFAFMAVWAFLKARNAFSRTGYGGYTALCVAAGLISMAAKPASIALPGVLALIAIWQDGWNERKRIFKTALVPVLLSFLSVWFVMHMTGSNNSGFMEDDWRVILHNVVWYPATALNPCPPVHPVYPSLHDSIGRNDVWFWIIGAVLMICASLFLARLTYKRYLPGLWFILLVLGVSVPVIGLLRYTDFDYCDRYNCLVSAAVIVGGMVLIRPWLAHWNESVLYRKICIVLAAAMILIAICKTVLYLPVWYDDVTFVTCLLNRPGKPNIKTVMLGHTVGFSTKKPDILERVVELFNTYQFKTIGSGSIQGERLRALILTAAGHAAMLRKDYSRAYNCLVNAEPYLSQNMTCNNELRCCGNYVYYDLLVLTEQRRDREAMKRYLKTAIQFINPALNKPLYDNYTQLLHQLEEKN